MTIETERIRSEPHVEIGLIIVQDAAELIERWCARARAEQPTAARVHHDALRNRLHAYLQGMGHGLMQAGEGSPQTHRKRAVEHGEQRWENGWSLTELVRDYQILQIVVIEHLASVLDRSLGHREAMAVGVFIDDAIAASIAAYVANRDQHVRDAERSNVETLRNEQARKYDFMALVAHELRNSVAPIVNATEALGIMLRDADAPLRDPVRLIRRQSRHLSRILDDLSDLTRMAQGRLTLRSAIVDVAEVVEQAVHASESLLSERGHRLVREIPQRPVVVEGDATRLVQIVVNLLNNAAKYTPPGGEVTIIARRRDGVAEIVVRDTGIGIPASMLDQVFDMYTRIAGAPESSPDGLGIGLALVRELVTLHGGSVECFSRGPGEGAEFVVTLPAYQGSEPVTRSTPEPVHLPSLRILVVDDDADGRESLTSLLRLMGHEVDGAPDAAKGIEQGGRQDYDAAIIDIGLPDRNGFEVAQELRAAKRRLLLVGLSGHTWPEHVQRAIEAGFDAYLTKPLDADALARLLFAAPSRR